MNVVGDFLICTVALYSMYRAYALSVSNAYQTKLCFLNNHPPAIIANGFDFNNPDKYRKVPRQALQQYRDNAVQCKKHGQPVEDIIFKY